jgi:hypothetical protein
VEGVEHIIIDLGRLQAVAQLSCADIAELLHAAAKHYCDMGTQHGPLPGGLASRCIGVVNLCGLSAARSLTSQQVLQPLTIAVKGSKVCTETLCTLPAVEQLSGEAMEELLQAALAASCRDCAKLLLGLPAAQWLSSRQLLHLLQAAVAS